MKLEELKIKILFFFVVIPIMIICWPIFLIWEIINNALRGLLFDLN
ncbi:hypothetical protein HN789_00695 [archaeon]|jgi:hypothetical protein|nr:hypothetical protein [archaeon]MBT4272659.1 hypothetical protein [archaeon]MBT4461457.1 hypothetical protein [archaeon]MBT4857773.1 hypothetical protein [archaeon]MBT5423471.1 hypothetical protein [archaeon]